MAFKQGDAVRIKDIRDNHDYPLQMRLLSGQCGHVIGVIKTETVGICFGKDRTTQHYYELDTDAGYGLWPEDFLEPYNTPKSDDEWIDTVLKLIAEIEGKLDQLKRQLWRKKHYGNGNH